MEIDDRINYPPVGGNLSQDASNWLRKDAAAGATYYGYAFSLGADPAAAVWRIRKETVTGTVTVVTYADGDGEYDNIWNNRASLTYK